MSEKQRVYTYKKMNRLAIRLRDDLKSGGNDFVLIYAYNGTGKTRLSMEFKDQYKKGQRTSGNEQPRDTLYFNAFTEDLFHWDNDLDGDNDLYLQLNTKSRFFAGLIELEMETRIRPFLWRYVDFNFKIKTKKVKIENSEREQTITYVSFEKNELINGHSTVVENIKVSRGEENIFIWCFYLALVQLVIDKAESYSWVEYLYIDDPISSLDDNNAIAVASDLARLLKQGNVKTVISSHHSLFFNVMSNELKKTKHKKYFLHLSKDNFYSLRSTDETPFFHHVAMLDALKKAVETEKLYAYHFNIMRNVLEKTATFFGFKDFSECLSGIEDEQLYSRALNLLSHGNYSIYEPKEMVEDNKRLFKEILDNFLSKYRFDLPDLH